MDALERLARWRAGVKIAHNAHIMTAARCSNRNRILGVPVVVMTTIIGTTVFTSIAVSNEYSLPAQVGAGLLSIAAAILSSVYTFLNYGELSERHRAAAVKYGNLRREMEEIQCFVNEKSELEKVMQNLRTRWDSLDLEAPSLPPDIHNKVRTEVMKQLEKDLEANKHLKQ